MSKEDGEWAAAVATYRRKMIEKREAEAKVKAGRREIRVFVVLTILCVQPERTL